MVKGNHSPFKLFSTNSTFSPAFQFLKVNRKFPVQNPRSIPSYKFSIRFELFETHDVHAVFLHNGHHFGSNPHQNLPRDFLIGTFQWGNKTTSVETRVRGTHPIRSLGWRPWWLKRWIPTGIRAADVFV